ncbi:MAG: NUDIX hydrolase [Actinobacteria bacterium]|nr:NUDIX hydrolase [Actinomycetota bacterium]
MEPNRYAVTVDAIVLTTRDGALHVLLIRRRNEPFPGGWALPGGFVDPDEDLPDAVARELAEETGIELAPADCAQIGAYGAPGRDPRGRTISIAFAVVRDGLPDPRDGDDAGDAAFLPVDRVLSGETALAFDHHRILTDAVSALPAASG